MTDERESPLPQDRTRSARLEIASAPTPGWYPDPYDLKESQRWWDGRDWSEAVAPQSADPSTLPGGTPTVDDVNFWSRLYNKDLDASVGGNAAASMSVLMGVLAIVTGVIPVMTAVLMSVAGAVGAIVWGLIGIRRARRTRVGLARAISGAALGCVVVAIASLGTAYGLGLW